MTAISKKKNRMWLGITGSKEGKKNGFTSIWLTLVILLDCVGWVSCSEMSFFLMYCKQVFTLKHTQVLQIYNKHALE